MCSKNLNLQQISAVAATPNYQTSLYGAAEIKTNNLLTTTTTTTFSNLAAVSTSSNHNNDSLQVFKANSCTITSTCNPVLSLSSNYKSYYTNENIITVTGDFYGPTVSYSNEVMTNFAHSFSTPIQSYQSQQYRQNNANYSFLPNTDLNYYWSTGDFYDGLSSLGATTVAPESLKNIATTKASAAVVASISNTQIATYNNNFQEQINPVTTMNYWNASPIVTVSHITNNSFDQFYDQTLTTSTLENNYTSYKELRKYDFLQEPDSGQHATIEPNFIGNTLNHNIYERNRKSSTIITNPMIKSINKLTATTVSNLPSKTQTINLKVNDLDLKHYYGKTKYYSCNFCGKQYCQKSTLKTHLKHHMGQKPFVCQICNKSFSQTANLTAHKRVHTGEKPFKCYVCFRPFSQSSSLVTHKRTHTGERPYPCNQCDKAFTDSSTLTKHLRTHTGQKPYSCHMCLMQFSQSGNLHRHMKTHDSAALRSS